MGSRFRGNDKKRVIRNGRMQRLIRHREPPLAAAHSPFRHDRRFPLTFLANRESLHERHVRPIPHNAAPKRAKAMQGLSRHGQAAVAAVLLIAAAGAALGLVRVLGLSHPTLLALLAWWLVSLPIGVLVGFGCSLGGNAAR
jgi:hypothetical protein